MRKTKVVGNLRTLHFAVEKIGRALDFRLRLATTFFGHAGSFT
jgi:hypothetical protein